MLDVEGHGRVAVQVARATGVVETARRQVFPTRRLRCSVLAAMVAASLFASCVAAPTPGPTVRITDQGWRAEPRRVVQPGGSFDLTISNETGAAVGLVVLQLAFGEIADLPTVDGIIDVTQQAVYASQDPTDPGQLLAVFYVVHPPVETEGASGWQPMMLDAGEHQVVRVGDLTLGGGEPGRYAVISAGADAVPAGNNALFELTDSEGRLPAPGPEQFGGGDEVVD